ncbi:DUF6185 family protein [Streptomyces sp. NPDC056660]|uniref:DUF6185 family protein n=1 Tax=Streptomyces sp. NPDC056660 TaxID=3345897 RepID=UPI00369D23C7
MYKFAGEEVSGVMKRWFGLLSLVILAVTWWGCPSATALSDNQGNCFTAGLADSLVDARIRFDEHEKNYVKVSSYMTIEVPNDWALAGSLTDGESTDDYRNAMRCLLRGEKTESRKEEWPYHDPTVVANGSTVVVQYDCFAWIKSYEEIRLGPWDIKNPEHDESWAVLLDPPELKKIKQWTVEAELGGLKLDNHSEGQSSATEETLYWQKGQPAKIKFDVMLPWQRFWLLNYDQSVWKPVGVAAWWVAGSVVIALAALRAQRAHTQRVPAAQTVGTRGGGVSQNNPRTDSPARTVVQWAALSGAITVALLLVIAQKPVSTQWRTLICITAGWVLVLVARPWDCRTPSSSPDHLAAPVDLPEDRQRRQARAVIGTASVTAAIGALVAVAPWLFDLPDKLKSEATMPTPLGMVGYLVMGLATLWLWMAAMTAWAWRFASEGDLLPTAWTGSWNKAPVRCVAAVSALLMVIAGCLFACLWWVTDNQWKRVAWLTGLNGKNTRGAYITENLTGFSFSYLLWIIAYSWVLTGIALFALLHYRVNSRHPHSRRKREKLALRPERSDLLLIATVFVFTVGLRGATFAGTNAQWSMWFILNFVSLLAVLAAGRKWAVLSQMGHRFYMHRLSNQRHRDELMDKVRRYRKTNRKLRLVNQGRADGATAEPLEGELRDVHQWLVAGCGKKIPPSHISVLDIALAWGPDDRWWDSALRAARLAFWFGIPATGALLYIDATDRYQENALSYEPTAIPNIVANVVAYQIAWAGAGFVLGALWRLLPGRSGPVRAWSLTIAYAVPAGLTVVLDQVFDTDPGYLLLFSLFMLAILTLTGIWMDTATFREEWQFCPSRITLLQSVYQLHGLSSQVTWLLAQVGAIVTIAATLAHR